MPAAIPYQLEGSEFFSSERDHVLNSCSLTAIPYSPCFHAEASISCSFGSSAFQTQPCKVCPPTDRISICTTANSSVLTARTSQPRRKVPFASDSATTAVGDLIFVVSLLDHFRWLSNHKTAKSPLQLTKNNEDKAIITNLHCLRDLGFLLPVRETDLCLTKHLFVSSVGL